MLYAAAHTAKTAERRAVTEECTYRLSWNCEGEGERSAKSVHHNDRQELGGDILMLYSVVPYAGFHEVATASDVRHKGLLVLVVTVGMNAKHTAPVAERLFRLF